MLQKWWPHEKLWWRRHQSPKRSQEVSSFRFFHNFHSAKWHFSNKKDYVFFISVDSVKLSDQKAIWDDKRKHHNCSITLVSLEGSTSGKIAHKTCYKTFFYNQKVINVIFSYYRIQKKYSSWLNTDETINRHHKSNQAWNYSAYHFSW